MKNIIPFKKDVIFKTNLSEITSISLEHTLNLNDDVLNGEFIISGEYKISDKSTTVEPFDIKIPFEIVLDDRYDTKNAVIDIDDFYYEIKNDNALSISIDVLVDKLSEKPLIEELVETEPVRAIIEENEIIEPNQEEKTEEKVEEKVEDIFDEINRDENKDIVKETESNIDVDEKINSIFSSSSFNKEEYSTYNVAIIREGDTIDSIIEKYNVDIEEIKKYNDISNLQLGDKLIIPNVYERD